jgi:hypothetical protein
MLRFIASIKAKKLINKIVRFGIITPDNWPEYKVIIVEALRLSCKADMNCSDDILYWNTFSKFRFFKDNWLKDIPLEYTTDLFVTLKDLSRKHNPRLWKMFDDFGPNKT